MAKQSLIRTLEENVMCSQVSRLRDGTKDFMFRKGYFYTNGATPEGFEKAVTRQLTEAGIAHKVINTGNHWASFNGGASVAKSSHFWVRVKIEE